MIKVHGYAAAAAKAPLGAFSFERREVGAHDVLIDIDYCGVCHSDIHQVKDEWGGSMFPIVPGHEIVGHVAQVGSAVKKYKVGDIVGVGCMVDACRKCSQCQHHLEQFCENGASFTYNGFEQDKRTPTYGGYSNKVVVNEDFVLRVPTNLELARVAPLLCAGITTYSPLRHWGVGKGQKVGIIGLGGLGHMGIKFAHAFGAEVIAITTSESKRADALALGAHGVLISKDAQQMKQAANSFDFLLCTVSAPFKLADYLALLKVDGKMVFLGVPEKPLELGTFALIDRRKTVAGSLIGGIAETQEMLDYCGKHNIACDIEMIPIQKINEAYERMLRSDVHYRFVIDMQSLNPGE
ncbi:MAG: hydroxyacid dehydrogenase [Verrucomicrobia bacterium 21-51-4]|nr:MAG: hydroxyacid dehydrogenase [Verrucomicrobia bacterium 21-51-4]HQU08569.1 NAD(P)-dependent alcohol dehydrogenase [Opitutales bacterium]